MTDSTSLRDDIYVLNNCTKYLARDSGPVSDSWRFPIIDSHRSDTADDTFRHNDVTFIYDARDASSSVDIGVIGTFAPLHQRLPLRQVLFGGEPTGFFARTVRIDKGQIHFYKFFVDGEPIIDPINPQRVTLDSGQQWSRLVTQLCTQPINLERWEYDILARLTAHILPFQTAAGEDFLRRYYHTLDAERRNSDLTHAYRLDNSIGVVNYIDNILAREEAHRLIDYKTCLSIIREIFRQRHPGIEPSLLTRDTYVTLYAEMADNNVPGWDYTRYNSPPFFLQILRRHAITGAFSHPKYGGNIGAAGWAFLSERYPAPDSGTMFAWRRAIEPPFGASAEYRG